MEGVPPTAQGLSLLVPPPPVKPENIQRTLVMVVDDLGLSVESLGYTKQALHAFVDHDLQPSDLVAVIRRMIEAPGTFDSRGWLTVGLVGHQPKSAEGYISTGSLYLCSVAFLPLGLPASDPFWSVPATPITSQKVWNGQAFPIDHALSERR